MFFTSCICCFFAAGKLRAAATEVVYRWFESSNNRWWLESFLWAVGYSGWQCGYVWSCHKEVTVCQW